MREGEELITTSLKSLKKRLHVQGEGRAEDMGGPHLFKDGTQIPALLPFDQ